MNDYIKVEFTLTPNTETECDILSALLCEIGFESFVPTDNGLLAYIKNELYASNEIDEAIAIYSFNASIKWEEEFIEGQDWNEEWEKNYFTPMLIGGKCVVHSTFHLTFPQAEHEIIINPKMSFGTGHHETTTLMVEQILNTEIEGKNLLDIGTGTGILAILGAKLGASKIVGIEIDEMAFYNAVENITLNNVPHIEILHGDASLISNFTTEFDIVLANINRNIIINDIARYSSALKGGGKMLLSGFYEEDISKILEVAHENSLREVEHFTKSNWAMMVLSKEFD